MAKKAFNKTLIGMVGRGDIQMTDIPEIKQDLNALQVLAQDYIGKDTPEIEIDRARNKDGSLTYLENKEECYGLSVEDSIRKYAPGEFKVGIVQKDSYCDCEMDETSKALVAVATHGAVDVEKPL